MGYDHSVTVASKQKHHLKMIEFWLDITYVTAAKLQARRASVYQKNWPLRA